MKVLDYMFFCHRRPDRSFFFRGRQFPLCARCTGIMCGYVAGLVMALSGIHLYFYYLLLFLPLLIDGFGQMYGKWESTNRRRFLTGIMAGIGIIYYFQVIITVVFPFGQRLGMYVLSR